jgi:hypothetical protein
MKRSEDVPENERPRCSDKSLDMADNLEASVQTSALNFSLLPPPPSLLGLKTVLGGQILAERESRGITEGVL